MGAFMEFESQPTEEIVNIALKMPGGGVHRLATGQITDDSELALSLGYGLLRSNKVLSLDKISAQYALWFKSPPFDIGVTIGDAFGPFRRFDLSKINDEVYVKDWSQKVIEATVRFNTSSQSNGGMMRITPLAVWCYKLSEAEILAAAMAENSLTHCECTLRFSIYIYIKIYI